MVKVDYEKAWKYTIHYWKKTGDLDSIHRTLHSQLLVKAKYSKYGISSSNQYCFYLFLTAGYSISWIFLLIVTKIYSYWQNESPGRIPFFPAVHNDAFFQNFYGATWIGKRSPFFYHFGIAYSPLWRVFAVICGN